MRAVLLDIDGVLTVTWQPLPGAAETLSWLQRERIPFRLVTNTSSRTRAQIASLLRDAGMEVDASQIVTAVSSAARHLRDEHPGAGCFVVNEGWLADDLEGIRVVGAESASVVLLGGAGPSTGYSELNAAFRLAMGGTPVVALHRNTRFETNEGPSLDMGAFIAGMELAGSFEVTVVGKPSPGFFRAALAGLGARLDETVMVGDDIESDVLGAQALGMRGILVRTGKFRPADLESHDPPDLVIESVAELPSALSSL